MLCPSTITTEFAFASKVPSAGAAGAVSMLPSTTTAPYSTFTLPLYKPAVIASLPQVKPVLAKVSCAFSLLSTPKLITEFRPTTYLPLRTTLPSLPASTAILLASVISAPSFHAGSRNTVAPLSAALFTVTLPAALSLPTLITASDAPVKVSTFAVPVMVELPFAVTSVFSKVPLPTFIEPPLRVTPLVTLVLPFTLSVLSLLTVTLPVKVYFVLFVAKELPIVKEPVLSFTPSTLSSVIPTTTLTLVTLPSTVIKSPPALPPRVTFLALVIIIPLEYFAKFNFPALKPLPTLSSAVTPPAATSAVSEPTSKFFPAVTVTWSSAISSPTEAASPTVISLISPFVTKSPVITILVVLSYTKASSAFLAEAT